MTMNLLSDDLKEIRKFTEITEYGRYAYNPEYEDLEKISGFYNDNNDSFTPYYLGECLIINCIYFKRYDSFSYYKETKIDEDYLENRTIYEQKPKKSVFECMGSLEW